MNHHPASFKEEQEEALEVEELAFSQILKKEMGYEIVEQEGDGNCLFRAVALQVYGDSSMHDRIRQQCLDFMARDPEHFAPFVVDETGSDEATTETNRTAFSLYIRRKRQSGVHGNNPEIQAMSELFNRPVEVYTPDRGSQPLNIFQTGYTTTDTPIRLSYHDGNHYNAVIDPLVPTAGLGLGLPGLQPGLADQLQVAQAKKESEEAMDVAKAIQASEEDEVQRVVEKSWRENNHSACGKQKAVASSSWMTPLMMEKVRVIACLFILFTEAE